MSKLGAERKRERRVPENKALWQKAILREKGPDEGGKEHFQWEWTIMESKKCAHTHTLIYTHVQV